MDFDGMTLIVKSSLPEPMDRHGRAALAMTIWGEGCPRDDNTLGIQ